jgi:hypothetical protein
MPQDDQTQQHEPKHDQIPAYVTATEARLMLGIGRTKLANMIREGTLPTIPDPADKKAKLVRLSDIERLMPFFAARKKGALALV